MRPPIAGVWRHSNQVSRRMNQGRILRRNLSLVKAMVFDAFVAGKRKMDGGWWNAVTPAGWGCALSKHDFSRHVRHMLVLGKKKKGCLLGQYNSPLRYRFNIERLVSHEIYPPLQRPHVVFVQSPPNPAERKWGKQNFTDKQPRMPPIAPTY